MARLCSLVLIIGLLPSGLAGPACAQKYKTASDCLTMCNQKWGYPGLMMGMDPWGTIMRSTGSSDQDWDAYIANACGETDSANASSTTSTSTVEATGLVKALGTQPGAVTTASSSSSSFTSTSTSTLSTSSIHSTSSTSSTHSTTSTTTSHTTSTTHTTTSTKPTTTSTSTKAQQTTTQNEPTPTHTTAQATHTSQSLSDSSNTQNSNSGSSSSGGAGSNASPADQQAYLEAHNTVRAQHGAAPVTWSNAAAAKAQQWADECTNTHSGGTLGPLGENLAAGTGTFTIAQAVGAWTAEVSEYNPNNPQPSHFTQVVWKATTEIGCAVQTCNGIFAGFGAAQYYVCEYSVQGNVIGNFAANVQV